MLKATKLAKEQIKKKAKNQKRKQEEEIKKQKVKKSQSADKGIDDGEAAPIKRPRGRPRKIIVAKLAPIMPQ